MEEIPRNFKEVISTNPSWHMVTSSALLHKMATGAEEIENHCPAFTGQTAGENSTNLTLAISVQTIVLHIAGTFLRFTK
jgi:hypothetical protein